MSGIQIGQISNLEWLMGFIRAAIRPASFHFLYRLLFSASKILSFIPAYPLTQLRGTLDTACAQESVVSELPQAMGIEFIGMRGLCWTSQSHLSPRG